MKLDDLYNKLRSLLRDDVSITMIDKEGHREIANVVLQFVKGRGWTHFHGKTISDALERAINKLTYPDKDYVDFSGHLWKADEKSVFESKYVRLFLKSPSSLGIDSQPAYKDVGNAFPSSTEKTRLVVGGEAEKGV